MTQYVINIGALPNDGTGDPLRTAFNDVNLNFNQVWATGLVGSNVQIANNTILTTNTNGNLILNPNGIGNVIANAHVIPDQNRVRNLGSSTRRWDTLYVQYANVGGTLTVAGDISVNGNLSVTGNIVEIGNIITDAKTIQLANTAGTANAADGSGITVGANDNIATFLYDSTDNAWVTNVRFETGNLILTDDRIMDLHGPSITNADLISGATSGLNVVSNGNANATTLFNTYGNIQIFTSNTGSNVKVFTFTTDGTLLAPGAISTTGNITGNYIFGNGSQLTGISSGAIVSNTAPAGATGQIWWNTNDGRAYVKYNNQFIDLSPSLIPDPTTYVGNVIFDNIDITNVGNIVPAANNVYNLGSSTFQWKDLYVSNATIYMNNVPISLTAGNILTVNGNDVVTTNANGQTTLGNLSVDDNNVYNTNGQGVVISNFSFIAEAETAYVQIPAGNSPSDLSIVQEQGNVRIAANAAAWSFNTNGITILPDNTNMGTIEGANTFGFYNNNANTDFLIELGPTNAWSFNGATGNLSVPQNINFNGGGIQQALNEDFYTKVSDNEDEGWSIFNAVDDGAGNTFTLTRLDNSEFIIRTDIPTNNYQWNFDNLGRLVVPGNIMGIYGGNTSFYAYDNGSGGSVELKTISYAGDALGSNIRVTQSNATISTSSGTHTWTFDGAGNLTLPSGGNIVGATANNSGRIQWLGNSSGDGAGYTTLGLIPDDTLTGNDQYLIIDPTAPGHIHIRAGGTQDNSNADLFLGGENTYFKVNAGANSEARISANSHSWVFGQDATLTVPGEGIIRSIQDTVILQSYDIYGNTYSARLGTNGGLYFETTDYPNGWLSLTNNTGNANITAASGTAGAGGKNINITAGSADQGDFYTTPGGDVNITGGLGAFNDGGGGGPGGNVNITAGLSADPAGVAGNVTIGSGTNYWQFLNNGNLYVPGQINGDNNGALVIDGAGYGNGYISLPASSFGGEQIVIVNDFSLGNGIRLQTNGGNLFFGNDGNLTLPGNTFSVNYANGTAVSLGGNYGDSNVASFLAAFGSNTITTTGNITASNFIGAGTNVDIVAGSYDWTFDTTGNLTLPGNSFTVNYANGAQVSLSGSYSNSNVTTLLAAFGSNTISTSGNITAGNLSVAGNVVNDISFTGGNILIDNATGGGGSDEGGELHFATATANSTLSGPIAIDIYQNKMRFFETQGNTFGMFIDIANSMGVAGSSLGVPAIGYRDVPQISLSANVTANVTNAGKHFYSTTAGNITLTIPDNANVAFPTGATLTIVMNAAGNVLVAQGTGVSLYMAGSSTTGNRAVGAYGLASVMKVDTNTWVISGTGVY